MSIDMAQFHQVFFEESFEGLEIMETGLMELEPGETDADTINSIFRAAHSIKGGSATFGFKAVAEFTHVMETLLDEMRDGVRDVTRDNSDLLLQSVDCLKEMLEAAQDGEDVDEERVAEHKALLEKELGKSSSSNNSSADTASASNVTAISESSSSGWKILFKPEPHLFQTANDPIPLIRELSTLGKVKLQPDFLQIPTFEQLEAEDCYMSWQIELESGPTLEQINEVFAWVDDLCELKIEALSGETAETEPVENKTQSASATAENSNSNLPVPQRRDSDKSNKENAGRRKTDKAKQASTTSIRVDTVKIDALINMVGELVITQSMLGLLGETIEEKQAVSPQDIEKMLDGLMQLERNTRELQENVMQVRMMPISFTFSRFPRLVRDMSSKMGKKIELKMTGEATEVDKNVIEKIGDPLVHLVRNSLDHGIEMPADRIANGKPETGTINLNAFHRGGNIVIEIIDDGKGMDKNIIRDKGIEKGLITEDEILSDKQIFDLIFMPGFSTAAVVSDVSGRGVGMDVVRRNIQELGGNVEINSALGVGTTMTIRLPLTLAILDGQTITVSNESYIIPIISIVESLQIKSEMINMIGGHGETIKLREQYIPIIRLRQILGVEGKERKLEEGLLVVVEAEGEHVGLFVDELQGQQQVVIKSLENNYKKIEGFSGATILGDGSVALILDMSGIMRLNRLYLSKTQSEAA